MNVKNLEEIRSARHLPNRLRLRLLKLGEAYRKAKAYHKEKLETLTNTSKRTARLRGYHSSRVDWFQARLSLIKRIFREQTENKRRWRL